MHGIWVCWLRPLTSFILSNTSCLIGQIISGFFTRLEYKYNWFQCLEAAPICIISRFKNSWRLHVEAESLRNLQIEWPGISKSSTFTNTHEWESERWCGYIFSCTSCCRTWTLPPFGMLLLQNAIDPLFLGITLHWEILRAIYLCYSSDSE